MRPKTWPVRERSRATELPFSTRPVTPEGGAPALRGRCRCQGGSQSWISFPVSSRRVITTGSLGAGPLERKRISVSARAWCGVRREQSSARGGLLAANQEVKPLRGVQGGLLSVPGISRGTWLKSSSVQISVRMSVAAQGCCVRGGQRALRSLCQEGAHWPRQRTVFLMTSSWWG